MEKRICTFLVPEQNKKQGIMNKKANRIYQKNRYDKKVPKTGKKFHVF